MKLTVVVSDLSDREHLSVSIKTPSSGIGRVEDCSALFPDAESDVAAMSDEEFLLFLMNQFQQNNNLNDRSQKDAGQIAKV